MLASAWQGDNSGATSVRPRASAAGLSGQTNPVPYHPVSLDTSRSKLVSRGGENQGGEVTDEVIVPAADWAWARCDAASPFPGTPDPTQICLKHGFNAARLYQVVFTAANPYELGMGFTPWRDVDAFFKKAGTDDTGTPDPIAKMMPHSIARGVSQSGNFLRGWLRLDFIQADDGSRVHKGMWPIIAGQRIALNSAGPSPAAYWSCTRQAAKGHSNGCRILIRYAATQRQAFLTVVRQPEPVQKS